MTGPIIAILLLIVVLLGAASYYLCRIVIYPHTMSKEKTRADEIKTGRFTTEYYDDLPKESVEISSPYGYPLKGVFIPVENPVGTIILTHGITWTWFGMIKYMELFRKRRFNVLLHDLRNHGESGGHNTTFGLCEKQDLKAWVTWVIQHTQSQGWIGTLGESLGAATTVQEAGMDPRLDFVISDCAYSDLTDLLTYRLKMDYHLPAFPLLHLASLWSKAITGMAFAEVSPRRDIQKVRAPMLIVHGQADDYIPPRMGEELKDNKLQGYCRLYLAPNAAHAQSIVINPQPYDQIVDEFMAVVQGVPPSTHEEA